jgi:hypothetical protein
LEIHHAHWTRYRPVPIFRVHHPARLPDRQSFIDREPCGVARPCAIETAALQGINDLDSFTTYLDELITWIPTEREIVPRALALHYIVNQAPGDKLNNDDEFSAWLKNYVDAWGKFLDNARVRSRNRFICVHAELQHQ